MSPRCLLMLPVLAACHPRVRFDVMRPAEVTLPPEVARLAVIDRAGNPLSGLAVGALTRVLVDSVRFEVVEQGTAQAAHRQGRTPAGARLAPEHAGLVCARTGATGIVSLERYEPSGGWSNGVDVREVSHDVVERHADGTEETITVTEEVPVYLASWTSRATAVWTVYGCDGAVLDDSVASFALTQDAEGATPGDARAAVGDPAAMDHELAESAGYSYFSHVSPYQDVVSRALYRGGSSDLRAGWKAWKAGDVEGAEQHWKVATKAGGDRTKGRALHDRAVAAELRGDLDQAVRLEKRADKLLDRRLTEQTLRQMRHRRAQEGVLADQLAPAPPPPDLVREPPPEAPPEKVLGDPDQP